MERWFQDNFGAIRTAIIATWFGFTKWLASKLIQRYEARMLAFETRLDHHEDEDDRRHEKVDSKISRVEDKIDAHYRIIDSKIESILHHLMTRSKTERDGDK